VSLNCAVVETRHLQLLNHLIYSTATVTCIIQNNCVMHCTKFYFQIYTVSMHWALLVFHADDSNENRYCFVEKNRLCNVFIGGGGIIVEVICLFLSFKEAKEQQQCIAFKNHFGYQVVGSITNRIFNLTMQNIKEQAHHNLTWLQNQ
jgi:hypothetical protein